MSTVGFRGSLIAFASVIGLALLTNPALAQHGGGGHSSGGSGGGFHGGGGGGFDGGGGSFHGGGSYGGDRGIRGGGFDGGARSLGGGRHYPGSGLGTRRRACSSGGGEAGGRGRILWGRESLPRQRVGNSPQCWLVRRAVVGRPVVECSCRHQRWPVAFV